MNQAKCQPIKVWTSWHESIKVWINQSVNQLKYEQNKVWTSCHESIEVWTK